MSYLFDEIYGKNEEAPAIEDKILLMGLQAAGKTAIKDVVFFNKSPEDMEDYMATVHYQRHFIDEEKSSMVIDSGGQESYWNEAVTHFRHLVFSNVKLLLWIVDVTHPEMFEESERRFSFTIRQYKKENPNGKITVLCHKVDLVPPERMVVIHQHVRESFSDPRFEVDFENTSIYYGESLKELVFTIMAEADIDIKRFELISNLGQKVEESEEFQSYLMEHKEDPRIEQLLDFLKPEPEITLPTFGNLDLQFDLTEYGIIEIVLIDKNTFSPIVGASSKTDVNTQNSMDYLVALHDFKRYVKDKSQEIEPTGTIVASSNEKVHGMIFNLASNFLLVTSFSEITEEKKKMFFELILKFAKSTTDSTQETKPAPAPVVVPEPAPVTVPSVPITEETATVDTEPIVIEETVEVPQMEIIETKLVIEEANTVEPEIMLPPSPSPVKLITEETEGEKEQVKSEPIEIAHIEEPAEIPKIPVESEPTIVEETPEILAEPTTPSVLESNTVSDILDSTEPVATLNGIGDSSAVSFSADDIKDFANFLVNKKETVLEEISLDEVKGMSDFLTKGLVAEKDDTIEEKEEQTVE